MAYVHIIDDTFGNKVGFQLHQPFNNLKAYLHLKYANIPFFLGTINVDKKTLFIDEKQLRVKFKTNSNWVFRKLFLEKAYKFDNIVVRSGKKNYQFPVKLLLEHGAVSNNQIFDSFDNFIWVEVSKFKRILKKYGNGKTN